MLASIATCAITGVDARLVHVEADVSARGLPQFTIVGLADTAIKEAGERVRAAIKNSGLHFPSHRTLISLAPADVRKTGPGYDLPIAVGLLLASGQAPATLAEDALFIGELALDGAVRHVRGILPAAAIARAHGCRRLFVPAADAAEAALIPGLSVYGVHSLLALLDHLTGHAALTPCTPPALDAAEPEYALDFREVRGQEHVKRALEIAAAGHHNCLLSGPPGSGKTLLARTLPSILPTLNVDEALEVTRIYSVADLLPAGRPLIRRRPFRAPHHTISSAGLVGGGKTPRPGEISLAHRGVLFLDELPEFGRHTLEALRQPLEAGRTVAIARANAALEYPANFLLLAALNPCPCGYRGDTSQPCVCSESALAAYHKRVSGPLLDRIDLHVEVPRVPHEKLLDAPLGEPSHAIRARVAAARARQQARFASASGVVANGDMTPVEIRLHCALDDTSKSLMRSAIAQLALSARGYHRTLKLARTIADLAGADAVQAMHLAEALQYRQRRTVF